MMKFEDAKGCTQFDEESECVVNPVYGKIINVGQKN